ncbi:hypothetical protein [Fodinicurvata fenggangensis]|uniref:hypothetical protein n=1 Tax=Fodinicurvata fenggangensis TaxID=1121830 RepID=UPI00047DD289
MPGSIEAYYQETGRAGRNGLPAEALMLYGPDDIALRRRSCAAFLAVITDHMAGTGAEAKA